MFDLFEVPSQPALVVVAPDGSVERVLGAVEADEIDRLLTAAGA